MQNFNLNAHVWSMFTTLAPPRLTRSTKAPSSTLATPAAFGWACQLPGCPTIRAISRQRGATRLAMVGPEGSSPGKNEGSIHGGKRLRGAQRAFINDRVLKSWDACIVRRRPKIGTAQTSAPIGGATRPKSQPAWTLTGKDGSTPAVAAASLVEFERAQALLLPDGETWTHLDRPDGLKVLSKRSPQLAEHACGRRHRPGGRGPLLR